MTDNLDSRMKAIWQQILDLVQSHGHALQYVLADPDLSIPSFIYTVGLSAKGMPDLIVFGLPQQASSIMNTIVEMAHDDRIELRDGQVIREAANLPLKLRSIDQNKGFELALGARRFAQEGGYTASLLQVVLPDAVGRFPGEDGCDPGIVLMQNIDLLTLKGQLKS